MADAGVGGEGFATSLKMTERESKCPVGGLAASGNEMVRARPSVRALLPRYRVYLA